MPAAATPNESGNAAQIAYWNDRAAVTWTEFQERLDDLFLPLTKVALDAAAPAAGERIVDVGCGCGATVLALADRVGASGRVTGVDVSEPMVARARQRIEAAGITNATVMVSDAATHVFGGFAADLLFSRFGVMFFADPISAFANLGTAMRPGGRLLFAAWRPLADNAWFAVPLAAARDLLPPQQPTEPGAPGPFALADGDRTLGILAQAGWRDAAVTRHDVPMRMAGPGGLEQAAEFATRVGALARALAEESADMRSRVKAAIVEAFKPYDSPEGITLTGSIWLISARR